MNYVKHKSKIYTVKRMRLLDYLIKLGFEPCAECPDATNWRFKNWIFENTPELEAAVEKYFEDLNSKK